MGLFLLKNFPKFWHFYIFATINILFMKKRFSLLLISFCTVFLFSQKSKKPYKAVDGITYNVGDYLQLGEPTNNGKYQTILYAPRTSISDVLGVIDAITDPTGSSSTTNSKKGGFADSSIKGKPIKIAFFKKENLGEAEAVFAYSRYDADNFLKILLDTSLYYGEVITKNKDFKLAKSGESSNIDNSVVSFDPNFEIKIIGAYGNVKDRTIKVEFTIYNKSDVAQEVYISRSQYFYTNSIMTDFDGNTYVESDKKIGSDSWGATIPSKIKMKVIYIFPKVMTNIKKISIVDIPMCSKNAIPGEYNRNCGNTYLKNIPVNWDDSEVKKQSEDGGNIQLSDKELDFDIISAEGDLNTKKVRIEYYFRSKDAKASICQYDAPCFVDSEGDMFRADKWRIGNKYCADLPTNVKIKGFAEMIDVPKSVKSIEYFNLPYSQETPKRTNGENEARKIKISWK